MNKKNIFIGFGIVALTALAVWGYFSFVSKPKPELDGFAQCLTDKKVTMYGAYWCSHCQRQKKLFGDAFRYINYIECTQDVKKCEQMGIRGYPTWVFEDDSRIEGEATIEQLAQKTSCPIPY